MTQISLCDSFTEKEHKTMFAVHAQSTPETKIKKKTDFTEETVPAL